MTEQDKAILDIQPNNILGVWWSMLNGWEWPNELPNPEPDIYIRGGRRGQLMQYIESRIGMKECLAEWNRQYPIRHGRAV